MGETTPTSGPGHRSSAADTPSAAPPMDIFELAKNIGTLLGTATVIAYASGYLALRSRALVLGFDPPFKLVDEIYVFAGFRLLLTALILLLIAAPLLWLIARGGSALLERLGDNWQLRAQWLALIGVAVMTFLLTIKLFSLSAVLFDADNKSAFARALLGDGGLRALLLALLIGLLVLCGLWLRARWSAGGRGSLEGALALVVGLQLVLLPVCHGAFYADRKVQRLAGMPEGVQGLVAPLAVVDRTGERATLLGLDAAGERRLVTVKSDDLNGIPVRDKQWLHVFVAALDEQAKGEQMAGGEANVNESEVSGETDEARSGLFGRLLKQLQITLDAVGSLGDSVVEAGQLWEARLGADGTVTERRRVGQLDDLQWPVAAGDGYYALRLGRLLRLDAQGALAAEIDGGASWLKLLGVAGDGRLLGLIRDDGEIKPAVLDDDGRVLFNPAALDETGRQTVRQLLKEERSHSGGRVLAADRSEHGGRGFDVYLRSDSGSVNISDCRNDRCGQASLAADFGRVVYVRETRF